LTPMPISSTDRRRFLIAGGAAALALLAARSGAALSQADARALIGRAMNDVQRIINSGQPEAAMLREFEALFARYGDVPTIARSVLGPPARTASAAQLAAFTEAFRGYMARKYGRQFRRFAGAQAQVAGARQIQRYWEVVSTMTMRGEPPFEVRWHVSDMSGRHLFFNLIIEGVNLLAVERQEIGAMLERRRGNLDALVQDLRRAG
jgi:phospholipid transport system substrate-binding protein